MNYDDPNIKQDAIQITDLCDAITAASMVAKPTGVCVATAITVERGGHRDDEGRVKGQHINDRC